MTPERTVTRLILYRRLLNRMLGEGARWVHSQELARMAGGTAAQVRRDLMGVGCTGTPIHGYSVSELVRALGRYLDAPDGRSAALIGIGRLGSAILAYFHHRLLRFEIRAAFDQDARKTGRTLHGCPCHPVDQLARVLETEHIRVAILTVPGGAAQDVADRLVAVGIRGIVNFTPVPVHVRPDVFVESIDITTTLEKVAFFAADGRMAEVSARRSP